MQVRGLHTRQRPSLLLGARKAHEVERHGFNPEAQCIHEELTNVERLQFSVERVREYTDVMLVDMMPASHIVLEVAESGWHKEQYPFLLSTERRPQSSGHGVRPASHDVQKRPRSAAGRSGQNGAEQRRFLDGSYTQPWELSKLAQACRRFSVQETLLRT